MEFEVKLPELGEDAGEEATVSFFFAEVGDKVDLEGDLVEMATDKATFTVPSPKAGVVKEHKVQEDDVVKVGDVLAILEVEE